MYRAFTSCSIVNSAIDSSVLCSNKPDAFAIMSSSLLIHFLIALACSGVSFTFSMFYPPKTTYLPLFPRLNQTFLTNESDMKTACEYFDILCSAYFAVSNLLLISPYVIFVRSEERRVGNEMRYLDQT